MSWRNIPRKENYMPLFAEDWNAVIDALDDLYAGKFGELERDLVPKEPYALDIGKPSKPWRHGHFKEIYTQSLTGPIELTGDIIPSQPDRFNIGSPSKPLHYIYAKYGYFEPIFTDKLEAKEIVGSVGNFDELLVKGEPVGAVDPTLTDIMQDVKVLLSELVVRESYITKQKMVDTGVESSPVVIHEGKKYHIPIVRGWFIVTDSTEGEIELRFVPSYILVAWLPANSLRKLANKDIYLPGYIEDGIWLYWKNLSPNSKIHTQLDLIERFEKIVANASGIDPEDPTWAPGEGWEKIWEFKTEAELDDFANSMKRYASVSDHRVVFAPPDGDMGNIERSHPTQYKRIAICLRVEVLESTADYDIAYGYIDDGTNAKVCSIQEVPTDLTKLGLYDGGSDTVVEFSNPNDWMVFVVDFEEDKGRVYDRYKNLLAEVDITIGSGITPIYVIDVFEDNMPGDSVTDVEVDWIAIRT